MTYKDLRKGAYGSLVGEMQRLLMKHGEKLPKYKDDNNFGQETLVALMSYQNKKNITSELGYCGPTTWNSLLCEIYIPKGKIADISKWQSKVNGAEFSKEADFVIARGFINISLDVKINAFVKIFQEYKIPYGLYHYTYAETNQDILEGAHLFVNSCKHLNPLYWVLDAEVGTLNQEMITIWANEMRRIDNKPIGIYCAHHRYAKYGMKNIKHLFDFVWIPRYGSNDGTMNQPKPGYPCDLWQYTSMGKIAGIKSRVDLNVITGQGKDLAWFRNPY